MVNNVEFRTSLDDKSYRKTIYWNTFCRKKALFIILVVMYAYGMFSVATIIRQADFSNPNILPALGVSFLCVILPVINIIMMESRIKKTIKQKDVPKDSAKKIHMNEHDIEVYRIEKNERLSFTWEEVEGVYSTPEQVIICMKNNMIFPMNKGQANSEQMGWVVAMAEEKKLFRTGMKFTTMRFIIILITGLALIWGTPVLK